MEGWPDKQKDRQKDRQEDRQTVTEMDRQTGGQRHTNKRTRGWTDKPAPVLTEYECCYKHVVEIAWEHKRPRESTSKLRSHPSSRLARRIVNYGCLPVVKIKKYTSCQGLSTVWTRLLGDNFITYRILQN